MTLPCGLTQKYDPPHFLETYMEAAGIAKPPPEFNLWCGLSLLAASCQSRIWFDKVWDKPLFPNLYVILIGPSGTGKGTAISHAQSIVHGCDASSQTLIAELHGKSTPQAMISQMAKNNAEKFIWLITPELSMSLGTGPKADDFIRHFTGLYEGLGGLSDWTRQHGQKNIEGIPIINWLAASTMDWTIDSIPRAAIVSGFFGRCCAVLGQRKSKVPTTPEYPKHQKDLMKYLTAYIANATRDNGVMIFSVPGRKALHKWFQKRAQPSSELLWPFWERQDDLVTKLAMLMARGDGFSMTMDERHVLDAISLTDWLLEKMPQLVEHAYRTESSADMQSIADWFGKYERQWVSRKMLMQFASKRGLTPFQVNGILAALAERGDLKLMDGVTDVKHRGCFYWWERSD